MSHYLSTKEAAEFISKSESTVKRFVAKIKKERQKDYKNNDFFQFEKLTTGHKKTFIEKAFLAREFNMPLNDSMNSSIESLGDVSELSESQRIIEVLRQEIEYKNTQLDKKDQQIDQLIERQRESNVLMMRLQEEPPQIEVSTKKKWWRKNKV